MNTPQSASAQSQSSQPTKTPVYLNDLKEATSQLLAHTGRDVRLGAQLGLGKPYELLNEIYDAVAHDSNYQMTIYTALSVNPPVPKSEIEERFLTPFLNRIYGKDFPRLKYVDAQVKNALPPNIAVEEFYMQSGAMLGSVSAQSHYASLNYTHVPEALAQRRLNALVQKVAINEAGELSLASNADLTFDVLDALRRKNEPMPFAIAVVDPELPFVGTDAIVPADMFDIIINDGSINNINDANADTATKSSEDKHLFALPRQPVDDVDYAIGLYASTLVKDGGTLQIGIGALADALCHALVLRHEHNATYRELLRTLDPDIESHPSIREFGGLEPFEQGLYGCSEMINEGFRFLVEAGIIRRRVVEDVEVMRRVVEGTVTKADRQLIETTGRFLDGAFYLGSPEFYDWVRSLSETNNTLGMVRISRVNSVVRPDYELECYKRQQPRFFNSCMMATALGGASSETLPDGRVVSGVGGQYNFVSMAYDLPNAKSVLMFRATRASGGDTTSNVLWNVANMTIPRHLRDVYITEYGIADLRYANDGDCIKTMVGVTEASFQQGLLDDAYKSLKLPQGAGQLKPQNNLLELRARLAPYRQDGTLPDYPLGSDFTPTEQDLVQALSWLKANTQSRSDKVNAVFDVFVQNASDKFSEIRDMFAGRKCEDDKQTRLNNAMIRMGYMDDAGNRIDSSLNAELIEHALKETLV